MVKFKSTSPGLPRNIDFFNGTWYIYLYIYPQKYTLKCIGKYKYAVYVEHLGFGGICNKASQVKLWVPNIPTEKTRWGKSSTSKGCSERGAELRSGNMWHFFFTPIKLRTLQKIEITYIPLERAGTLWVSMIFRRNGSCLGEIYMFSRLRSEALNLTEMKFHMLSLLDNGAGGLP